MGTPDRAAGVVAAVHAVGATRCSTFTTWGVATEPVAAERAP
jgi:hypothetical protein